MQQTRTSSNYAAGILASLFVASTLAFGSWAVARLIDHGERLARTETINQNVCERVIRIEAKLDSVLEKYRPGN